MIEIKGKYNEAKIFTDVVDSASIAQVQELCNQEFTAGSRIRLMPDIHAGAGCTIGTTMTITDKVVPNLVGVDIGCGMETTRIREGRLELQKLDKLIYEKIPSGFSIRDKAHRYLNEIDLSELCCARHVDLLRAEKSIGTLGGGNHFIEVDKDDEGNLYIVVHSGSRHLGVEVASYYQEAGYKVLNRTDDASIEALIARMKAEGREKEIQKELKKLKNLKQTNIPKALAYVSGELFEQYSTIIPGYTSDHSVCVITPLLGAQWARTQSAVQLTHSEFTRASWYSSVQPRTVLWTYYIIIPVHISSPVSSSAPIIPIKEDSIYSS